MTIGKDMRLRGRARMPSATPVNIQEATMGRPVMKWVLGCWLLVVMGTATAKADAWTDALFPETKHDFGMVPRGVKVKHDFLLVNRLSEPITIVNLRPSCGCTSGKARSSTVAPGQTTVIEAEMDTRNFVGPKATVLFVTLVTAGGREAEARLAVSSHILSDIVLNPGAIDFGTVKRGQSPSQVLTIDRINNPNWRFTRMVSASRALDAQLVETARKDGAVSYALHVSLKPAAPIGTLRDELRLFTNDPENPSIPIMVTGVIRGDLTAAPSVLALGQVHSSAGAQGRFIVRSSRPFAIRSIEGAGDGFLTSAPDSTRQPTHVVTVAYKPEDGAARGDIRRVFRVHTDLPDEPSLDLTATLHVVP
jgi:hypothetical protein